MVNPKSLKNLRKIEKGKSGNPKGKPRGAKNGLRANLVHLLAKKPPEQVIETLRDIIGDKEKINNCAAAVAWTLLMGAMQGDATMIKMLLDQTEEPLRTTAEVEHTGGVVLEIIPPPASFLDDQDLRDAQSED